MKLPPPCPFCGETPNHLYTGAVHPNNDCILNGVVCSWDQWQDRPGEQAARAEVLELVKLTLNAIIKHHHDNPLSYNKMANKEREAIFTLEQICNNYQLKFGKLIEAEV